MNSRQGPVIQEADPRERNSLLRAIPPAEYELLRAQATTVPLTLRRNLFEANELIPYVWFPQSGMVSLVSDMHDERTSIEVGVVGRDGVCGLHAVLGVESQPLRALVQLAGEAKRIPVDKFAAIFAVAPKLSEMVYRYAAALMNQGSQQVACNRLHSLEQRCAKWLLTTHDHLDIEELPLTQEYLAVMLGVRRPGVTVAAQTLQDAGLIRYRRGRIAVTDRGGLEKVACECYRRIRADYESILGSVMIPPGEAVNGTALQPAA